MITWEPWLSVFDNTRHPHLPLRDVRDRTASRLWRVETTTSTSTRGHAKRRSSDGRSSCDSYEMNDPYRYPWGPQHNTKEEFIAAWRRVVTRFRSVGAHNVIWVWSPHVAHQYWELYYPGAEFVDWTATGALNSAPSRNGRSGGRSRKYSGRAYERLAEFGKPSRCGVRVASGVRRSYRWYQAALESLPT